MKKYKISNFEIFFKMTVADTLLIYCISKISSYICTNQYNLLPLNNATQANYFNQFTRLVLTKKQFSP